MRILSQTNDIHGYHGTIGTPNQHTKRNRFGERNKHEKRYIFSVKRYKEWCRQTGEKEYSWSYECDGCEIDPETSTVVGKNGIQYICTIDEDACFPWYEVITEVC